MIRWKLWHVKRHDTWKLIENTENTERSERTLQIKAHVSALMFSAQNWHGNDVNNVNMRNELTESPSQLLRKRLVWNASFWVDAPRRVSAALRPETRRTRRTCRSSPWRRCLRPVERWNDGTVVPGDQWRQSATGLHQIHQMKSWTVA